MGQGKYRPEGTNHTNPGQCPGLGHGHRDRVLKGRFICARESSMDGQEEHHRTRGFQDEYREFLKKYEIEYDERYVWD